MRPLKVLVLFDTDYAPPRSQTYARRLETLDEVEFEVAATLTERGHEVSLLGFKDDLGPLVRRLLEARVDVVFNLVERFREDSRLDAPLAGLLDLIGVPYTGAPAIALALGRDKARTKEILSAHGIPVPRFFVCRRGRPLPRRCPFEFPVIVKPLDEDASTGVTKGAVVQSIEGLRARAAWVHNKFHTDAICEEFIDGRELYVAVLEDGRPRALPPIEMAFPEHMPVETRIATFPAK